MKKKTLLIVSTSFALGVGVIGSGVGALLHQKASTPGVMEDATLPSDEIGARVRLGAEGDATTDPTVAAPTFVNTLGYRLIDETGYSFPSGHSMISAAFYGLIIYFIWKNVKNIKWKYISCILLALLILFIGISRIYLGVHYASDVLGGFTISIAYLIIFTSTFKAIYK